MPQLNDGLKIVVDSQPRTKYVFMAMQANECIGTAAVIIDDKESGRPAGLVEDVKTAESHQRRGVATWLLNQIEDFCRDKGCYKLVLACRDEILPLYEQCGYKRHENGMRKDLY